MNYEQETAVKKLRRNIVKAYNKYYYGIEDSIFSQCEEAPQLKLKITYTAAIALREIFAGLDARCPKIGDEFLILAGEFLGEGYVQGNHMIFPLGWHEVNDFCRAIEEHFIAAAGERCEAGRTFEFVTGVRSKRSIRTSELNPEVIKSFLDCSKSVTAVSQQLAEGNHTMVILGQGWSFVSNINPHLADEKEACTQALYIVQDIVMDEDGPKYPLPIAPDSKCERFAWLWFRNGDTLESPSAASITDIVRSGKPIHIDGVDVYLRERD